MLGQPTDFRVVFEHGLAECGRADEPAFSWVLDQRVLACSPAEWVIVNILFLVPEQPSLAEGSADGSIGVFNPDSLVVGRIGVEFPVGAHCADQSGAFALGEAFSLLDEDFVVDFAKGGCKVDDSSS